MSAQYFHGLQRSHVHLHRESYSAVNLLGTLFLFRHHTCACMQEGIDVPECNAVIRFDGASNDIALTQSKGRVRANGDFVVLFSDGKQQDDFENAKKKMEKEQTALAAKSQEYLRGAASLGVSSVHLCSESSVFVKFV